MATQVINGTAGNDVINAHPDAHYVAGQLVFVLGGMPSQGGWPTVNILVNGSVVRAGVTIDTEVRDGHTETVSVPLPAGVPVTSVGIRYTNDLVTTVDDRNVYVGSVSVNGVELALSSATYVRDDYPAIAGQNAMNWNGTMTWSGAAVQNAAAGGGQADNVSVDAGAGIDTLLYQGRASAYGVSYTGSGFNVTPASGAFATDTLANVENLLFDDRSPYPYGAGGATAVVDASQGTIDGGGGIDTLYLRGAHTQYTITHTDTGFSVTGNGVNEWVTNVERLAFTDGFVGLDIKGDTGMAYRIYQAAFNRTPDTGGLGFWINAMDNGMGLEEVSANFIGSVEFQATYGGLNNAQFVTQIYQNVLHRAPDPGGLAFWQNQLDSGTWTRAVVLTGFSESNENQANVIGVIQDGAYYN
ncbi:MAG: DUF4214 domain-containing protein, partial [Comamonadaceae bacterium]